MPLRAILLLRGLVTAPSMKILFAFENALPSNEADAEVFLTTARYLAPLSSRSWLHVPLPVGTAAAAVGALAGLPVIRAYTPTRPAALRHLCCGLTLIVRRQYWQADLVYTRNLWIAWMAMLFGKRVAFDHYRPWPDQIPPLQLWIYRLVCNRKFLINICHSDYTRRKYLGLGIPESKLRCVHNGFEPQRLLRPLSMAAARRAIGVPDGVRTVVYTGRLNHKKGLDLVIEAARRLPDLLFVLVGSYGEGSIETSASTLANVRIVRWQAPEMLPPYIFSADVLLIPPSWKPLAAFGSTVLPLKLFFYMASGRPILAGATPDVREILRHNENAFLCTPDCPESLVGGITALTQDTMLARRLAATALMESRDFTWQARAHKIADILEDRLRSGSAEQGHWGSVQSRTWMRQSWRWLAHLIRHRSWVLPPASGSLVDPAPVEAK